MIEINIEIKQNGSLELEKVKATDVGVKVTTIEHHETKDEIKVAEIIKERIKNGNMINERTEIIDICNDKSSKDTINKIIGLVSKL